MSFLNLTGMATYKKSIARVFARSKFSDLECDMIETSKAVPSSGGYIQINTGDGGVTLTPKRTVSKLGDQQKGNTRTIQDDMEFTLEITVAQLSLPIMQDLILLDPTATTTSDTVSLKANRSIDITDSAVSFVIYDKNYDATNETNTPDLDCDSEMIVIYKATPEDAAPIVLDNKQGTAKLTFSCLVSRSNGSSSGSAGRIGKFTAA